MARQTVHIAPDGERWIYVAGTLDAPPSLMDDRRADGAAFPGERRVRLPRRAALIRGLPEWHITRCGDLTTRRRAMYHEGR